MIKRFCNISIICVICMFIFVMLFPGAVQADVVFGNEFYELNEDETEPAGKYGIKLFVTNSPSGYVIPKEEPGSENGVSTAGFRYKDFPGDIDEPENEVFVFENGNIFYLEATYLHDGEYWGIMSPTHAYQPPGWVLMDELLVVFDQEDFEFANKDSFYTYTGNYDAVLMAKKLVAWQWPGSDREKRIIDSEEYKDAIPKYADVLFSYKDPQGREWGKSKYSEAWICLSDPENSKIPAFYPAPSPAKWSPDGNHKWSSAEIEFPDGSSEGSKDNPTDNSADAFTDDPTTDPLENPDNPPENTPLPRPVPIIILVIALVAGTLILIRIFRKKGLH